MSEIAFRQGTDSKMEQARQSFVKILRHKQDMDDCAMKLLKHPATTGSQIMEARGALLAVEEPLGRVVRELRKVYPYRGFSDAPRPWHKSEFDKYMEVNDGV
jgi:hypothetical protein